MRLLIITKKRLLTVGISAAALVLALFISVSSLGEAVEASGTKREIPIYYVDRQDKVVSISFDAAWGNEQTQTLLDILKRYDVKSTFFLVGQWVDNYPESVKAIADAGHDVGNHSNSHPQMSQLSTSKMTDEISTCNDKIKQITGKAPTLFRPPYGDYNNAVVNAVRDMNMYCIQWDVDSLDWKDPTAQDMTNRVLSKIKNGSIILMHNGAKNTPEALPMIIEGILAKGYKIVPISEILLQGAYTTDHEGKMISAGM